MLICGCPSECSLTSLTLLSCSMGLRDEAGDPTVNCVFLLAGQIHPHQLRRCRVHRGRQHRDLYLLTAGGGARGRGRAAAAVEGGPQGLTACRKRVPARREPWLPAADPAPPFPALQEGRDAGTSGRGRLSISTLGQDGGASRSF